MVKSGIGKIVKHGRSQIVLLPADFFLPGKEARVTRVGDKILLTPMEDEPKGKSESA